MWSGLFTVDPLTWTLSVLAAAAGAFISGRVRNDLTALLLLLTLAAGGVITVPQALSGFSNPVVIMIASLFVVGTGIFQTGLASSAGQILLNLSRGNERILLILIMILTALMSGFMSNTGAVAVLLPVVVSAAVKIESPASRFLIPLAYGSSIGGSLTLIGTPPNLIASQTLADSGYSAFHLFSFTPLGISALVTALLYLTLTGRRILPSNGGRGKKENKSTGRELEELWKIHKDIHVYEVSKNSPAAGKSLRELSFPASFFTGVLRIDRYASTKMARRILRPAHRIFSERNEIEALPDTVIRHYDRLWLQGHPENVRRLAKQYDLKEVTDTDKSLVSGLYGLVEILIPPLSVYHKSSLFRMQFREKYGLNALAVRRGGTIWQENISRKELRHGDAILAQGPWDKIELLAKNESDLVVVGRPVVQWRNASGEGKALLALSILLAMGIVMAFELIPAVFAALGAALAMILTRCIRSMRDAYRKISWESVVLIAAMIPVSDALKNTGVTDLLVNHIIINSYGQSPWMLLAGIYITVMIISQFISNTATAVIFAPIALQAAVSGGYDPHPFLAAVGISASMAFSSPVASTANALVISAGSYRFSDFLKVGIPLQLAVAALIIFLLPQLFPF